MAAFACRSDGLHEAMPDSLRARAHVTGSGELLWPREDAPAVLDWLCERSAAVIAGEAYGPRGQANFCLFHQWRTEPSCGAGESWRQFVERAAGSARAVIEADSSAGVETPAMYFFVCLENGE